MILKTHENLNIDVTMFVFLAHVAPKKNGM